MDNFNITTDSTCDLPASYLAEHGIETLSLNYLLDGETYGGGREMDPKAFYSTMREGKMPTTNACNPLDAKECFLKYIKQGKAVLHIAFSSGLSASYNNARLAAEELMEEYPDARIRVIDSLCASLGEGLLIHKAAVMRENGGSFEETADWVEQNRLHICHQFTVDDLFHLHRGGRVSKATAVMGTMINVKPVLHVDNEGHLIPLSNVRGRKKSLNKLVDNMAEAIKGYEQQNDIVFISHGDCEEEARYVASVVKERFGIEKFLFNFVGPTIGAHSGPGTLALFFVGSKR